MRQKIQGLQVHHSKWLDDSNRGAVNMCAGLRSARGRRPDDPELKALEKRAVQLARDIGKARQRAQERLGSFPVDVVVSCRDGEAPWPDEPAPGFVARCTCYDKCAIHDLGRDEAEGWICNCGPCLAHEEAV